MKRSAIQRHKRMRRCRSLTVAERTAYSEATERARHPEGYLVCESCHRSLKDGEESRHHVVARAQGGPTTAENLVVICPPCHDHYHRIHRPVNVLANDWMRADSPDIAPFPEASE